MLKSSIITNGLIKSKSLVTKVIISRQLSNISDDKTGESKSVPPDSQAPMRNVQAKGAMKSYFFNRKQAVNPDDDGSKSVWGKLASTFAPNQTTNKWSPKESTKSGGTTDTDEDTQAQSKSSSRIYRSNIRRPTSENGNKKSGKRGKVKRERMGGPGGPGGGGEITPAVEAMLKDHEYFQNLARSGMSIETEDLDELDTFLATTMMEAFKSESGEFTEVIRLANFRKTLIPQPRPLKKLLQVITPDIYEAPLHSEGYKVGVEAWEAISKNFYFTDAEKSYICNSIAKVINRIEEKEAANVPYRWDEAQLPSFRKGMSYMEEEHKRMVEMGLVPTDSLSQADTDWSVEAVTDEDDLT